MARIQKGPSIAVLAIGILQLLVGLSITISGAVFASKLDGAGAPYWASIPLMLLGILGIAAGATRNKCAIIAFLVFCILLTIALLAAGAIMAILSAIFNLALDYMTRYGCYTKHGDCYCYKNKEKTDAKKYGGTTCAHLETIGALIKLITALSIVGGLLALAGSIVSCVGLCQQNDQQTVVVHQTGPQTVVIQQPPPATAHQQAPPPSYDQKPAIEQTNPGY